MSDAQEWLRRETDKAVRMVTWQLRERGDADDEPVARAIVEAFKGAGWRPTMARPAPDWRMRGTSGGRMSDADRAAFLERAAAATEAQRQAAGKARRIAGSGDYPPGYDGPELDFDGEGFAR